MPGTPLLSYNCNTPNATPLPSYTCNVCGAKGEHWRVNCPTSAQLAVEPIARTSTVTNSTSTLTLTLSLYLATTCLL